MDRNKAKGMLWGLVVGDAFGSPIQFSGMDSHPWITEMVACPVFGLPPGYWTDDGSNKVREVVDRLVSRHVGGLIPPMEKILKYPLVAKTAIWYNARRQDIRRRLAERPIAPTEWNTTVVAEEAMCPKGKHVPMVARLEHKMCGRSFARECPLPEKLD